LLWREIWRTATLPLQVEQQSIHLSKHGSQELWRLKL
jgi:hypothetical protein